jgi:hypothetical protein
MENFKEFEVFKEMNSNSFNYSDNKIHTDIEGDYCYKILAISNPNQNVSDHLEDRFSNSKT